MSFIVPACACDLNISVSQRGILTAIPFFGTVCTLFLWGYLADRKGRRIILICSMIGSSVFGFLSSFSPNWMVMAAFRFLSACFSSGSNSIVYVLLGECCPARHRAKLLLSMTSGLSFCQSISGALSIPILPLGFSYELSFLGIYYKPWRLLVQLLAIPNLLSALSLYFFFESPRFLASVGREEEGIEVLKKIHTINTGKDANMYEVQALSLDEIAASRNVSFLTSLWSSVKIMFKPPLLKYTMLLYWLSVINYTVNTGTVMWFPFIMNGFFNNYFSDSGSESLNICGLLDKARNIDFITNDTTYIEPECNDTINPVTAYTAIAVAVYGFVLNLIISFIPHKKYIAVVLFIVSGIIGFLINVIFIPIASVILSILFVSTGGVNGIMSIYYVELFPTSVRGTVSSLGIMVGRISGFTCITITGYYIDTYCSTIYQIFGSLFLAGGLCALLLPNNKRSKKV